MSASNPKHLSPSRLSVIIAAYNHFEWLRLVLEGLRNQTVTGLQIVIADDGSDDATVRQIRDYIASHPAMNIIHVWQEDDGWRKNQALTIHRNHPTATFAIPGRSDNNAILEDNKRQRLTFTPYGISKVQPLPKQQ